MIKSVITTYISVVIMINKAFTKSHKNKTFSKNFNHQKLLIKHKLMFVKTIKPLLLKKLKHQV